MNALQFKQMGLLLVCHPWAFENLSRITKKAVPLYQVSQITDNQR